MGLFAKISESRCGAFTFSSRYTVKLKEHVIGVKWSAIREAQTATQLEHNGARRERPTRIWPGLIPIVANNG